MTSGFSIAQSCKVLEIFPGIRCRITPGSKTQREHAARLNHDGLPLGKRNERSSKWQGGNIEFIE
jgi:hypothetical protein